MIGADALEAEFIRICARFGWPYQPLDALPALDVDTDALRTAAAFLGAYALALAYLTKLGRSSQP